MKTLFHFNNKRFKLFTQPCAEANPAVASRFQSTHPVRQLYELGALSRFTMHRFILIALAGLLGGCASPHSPDQRTNWPYDPTIPVSPPNCIPVNVSFEGDESTDADGLKHKAKQILKDAGNHLDDAYHCVITVSLRGRDTACTVTFHKGFENRIYFVDFDRAGNFQRIRTGIATEGGKEATMTACLDHAQQRLTRRERRGRNPCDPWAGSLSLGLGDNSTHL